MLNFFFLKQEKKLRGVAPLPAGGGGGGGWEITEWKRQGWERVSRRRPGLAGHDPHRPKHPHLLVG